MSEIAPQLHNLPPKRQRYIHARLSQFGKSKRNAALEAGYSQSVANKPGLLETPDVKAVFRELMQRAVPPPALVKALAEGMQATKTEYFSHQGEVKDQREHIAWAERREYAKMAAEYAGYISRDEDRNVNLHVMLSPPVDDDPVPVQSQGQVRDQVIDVASKPV